MKQMKFIFITICLCFLLFQPCAAQYPSEEEHDWVSERYEKVLEELFPFAERPEFVLGYRSYEDLHRDKPESSFVFVRGLEDKLSAVLRKPQAASLYDQIIILHRRTKKLDIAAIKSQIKIKEWSLSEVACPAVKRQYDKFYEFSLPTLSAKDRAAQGKGEVTITLHLRIHAIEAVISGGSLKLVLHDYEHPFVRWAEETQRALEACVTKTRWKINRQPGTT